MPAAYRMPAEWEPHRATWIAWPHHAADWPGKFAAIPWVYAEIVRHLTQSETVCILVSDAKMEQRVRRILRRCGVNLARVDFHAVPTDRVWTRDYCPLFVVNGAGEVALTDWHFNGWAKYPNWKYDDAVVGELAGRYGWRMGRPSSSATRPATASSRCQFGYLAQPLKCQSVSATSPFSPTTKMGQ